MFCRTQSEKKECEMSNKNKSKTGVLTPEYMATLCNGKTKRFVLMRPNPENPSQPGKTEFVKGVPVPVDQATKEHLEKHATFSKTAHFQDGEVEQTVHCCFDFEVLPGDDITDHAKNVT